jgi:hypothetical protein
VRLGREVRVRNSAPSSAGNPRQAFPLIQPAAFEPGSLEARTVLYKTYLKLDNAVKGPVRADPICRRLMSIPGVGPVTALTFKAAVDDPNRFKSSAPWLRTSG